MSLSQKHTGKVFVPWFNTAEWKHVYNILCVQTDSNYPQALKILKIWKCRTPLLSAGVEGTFILLEALLVDKDSLLEHQLVQIYALSIMRFLNLCATNNEKQGTFYKTAIKNDLPKWLINIRHDIAHDHKLPSISVLELGLQQCLDWIKLKYWQVQNKVIYDFVVTEEATNPKIIEILEIYVRLNLKSLSTDTDVADYDENLIEQINNIVFEKSKQPTNDISDIISILEEYINDCLSKPLNDSDKGHISKVIHGALLSTKTEITPEGSRVIPKEFRNTWSTLLNILNESNLISLILDQLIDTTNNVELENSVRETAALWISELFLGLQKAQMIQEEINKREKDQLDKATVSKIKSALEEKYPQYNDCLEFFSTEVLYSTNGKIFEDKMLNAPSDFTLHFLEKALQFNKKSENYISDITNLVKNMLITNGTGADREIFTTDDLENVGINNSTITEEFDSHKTVTADENAYVTETSATRWKPVKDKSIYKGCPLGILPHQNSDKNPLIAC